MPVIKPVGQTTPTYILGQHFLLFRCCQSALCFQLLQQADSSHIVGIPLTGCAYTQIIVGNAEIVALATGDLRQQHCYSSSCFRLGRRRCQHLRLLDGDFTELAVSFILGKHRFKPFLTFCSEHGISQSRVTQLHLTIPNLLNTKCGIVQIDGIANGILPKHIVCSHSDLCQLFLCERVQVIHIRVQQFFFSQFFQRTVLAAVYNDPFHISVNTEVN